MIPITGEMPQELQVVIQRLNDLHTRLQVLQHMLDAHSKLLARLGRDVARQRASAQIHRSKVRRETAEQSPGSQH